MFTQSFNFWVVRSAESTVGAQLGAVLLCSLIFFGSTVQPVQAQSDETVENRLEDIVVSTTRSARSQKQLPESVTVVEKEEIEKQSRHTNDLGEIAANLIPGLGESSENLTNAGQNLRGRSFLVMIDGVPQNASLRAASKHLRSIAPEAIQRIEVIRGSVATHGIGATGGIIHFITKSGADVDGQEAQTTLAITGQEDDSESLGGRIYQGLRGSTEKLDYSLNISAKQTGVHYDGEGDVIPADGLVQGGSLSENDELNLQTKIGYTLAPDQDLEFALNHFDREQNASYRADRTTGDTDPNKKTRTEPGSPQGQNPGTENTNLSLTHTWSDVLGGELESQAYYQDYETQFSYYAFYPSGGGQSQLLTEHSGLRVTHNRTFENFGDLVYGIDYDREETTQNLLDGRTRTGEMTASNYAPFVQIEVPFGENWSVRAGARHVQSDVDIPTFQDESLNNPATIQGSTLDYSETLLNAGAVYYLSDRQDLFLGYSEGFSVADIGRALRGRTSPPAAIEASSIDPQAQVVKNYELGWRLQSDELGLKAVSFYNTSDLGTTFSGPPNFTVQRQKEEIYGLEVSGRYRPTDRTTYGGSATYQQGQYDSDGDGAIDRKLPSTRITPPRLTAHVEHDFDKSYTGRLQGKYLFDRDPLGNGGYPEGDVNGFGLVDGSLQKSLGNHGSVTFAVSNLLDEQYIVPISQAWNIPSRMVAGKGRSFTLEYSTKF